MGMANHERVPKVLFHYWFGYFRQLFCGVSKGQHLPKDQVPTRSATLANKSTQSDLGTNRKHPEKYKIVSISSPLKKLSNPSDIEEKQVSVTHDDQVDKENFYVNLNFLAKKGYRVKFRGLGATLLELDESEYEYESVLKSSSIYFVRAGLTYELPEKNKDGYRLSVHSPYGGYCNPEITDGITIADNCLYHDAYLFEKDLRSRRPVQQAIVRSGHGWRAKPGADLTEQLKERLEEGYYPVILLSRFEILVEKIFKTDQEIQEIAKTEFQIIRSGLGTGNFKKRLNDLAKEGYRIGLIGNEIALMFRNEETKKSSVSYTWLRSDKKNFPREVARLEQTGAKFTAVYPNPHGEKNSLVFEQNLKENRQKSDVRILNFEVLMTDDQVGGKFFSNLTPDSMKNEIIMNELAKEGFVVRGMYDTKRIRKNSTEFGIIMERAKSD